MTLEAIDTHRGKLMTACAKVCLLRIARINSLVVRRDVAVNATDQAVLFCADSFDHCPVPVVEDVFEMLSSHDLNRLHTKSIFIVFCLGWRDVFRASCNGPEHEHADSCNTSKAEQQTVGGDPFQGASLGCSHK